MSSTVDRDAIISELYNRYKTQGFITEDEALACFVSHNLSLTFISSITDQLLSIGVIIRTDDFLADNEEEIVDKTRTDYDNIFIYGLQISPELSFIVNYLKKIKPPPATRVAHPYSASSKWKSICA